MLSPAQIVSLQNCTSLRSVDLFLTQKVNSQSPTIAAFPLAVLHILPLTLAVLTLEFSSDGGSWSMLDPWLEWVTSESTHPDRSTRSEESFEDKLLVHLDRLPNLKEVRFTHMMLAQRPTDVARRHGLSEESKDQLRRAFPKMWQRGLLSFDFE